MGQGLSFQRGLTGANDAICIKGLSLRPLISDDGAGVNGVRRQTVSLSLTASADGSKTTRLGDEANLVDSNALCKMLQDNQSQSHTSLEAFVEYVFDMVFDLYREVAEANIVASTRDDSPHFTVEAKRRRGQTSSGGTYQFIVDGLSFPTIVGVPPAKRVEEQPVVFRIVVRPQQRASSKERFPFTGLSMSIRQTFARLECSTIEALTSAVKDHVLEYTRNMDYEVVVQLSKSIISPPVVSTQSRIIRQDVNIADNFLPGARSPACMAKRSTNSNLTPSLHSVALGLASNLGDRFANIEAALRLLEIPTSLFPDLRGALVSVVDTSFMYETAPMYVIDQPRFINCACLIETNLEPKDLLYLVKAVEGVVGRTPSKCHGPCEVDLDILTYDNLLWDTRPLDSWATLNNLNDELVIPHPRMCAREFVLRPLNDMIPGFIHPTRNKTIRTLLDEVIAIRSEDNRPMYQVMPFPKYPLDNTEGINVPGIRVPPTAEHWIVSPTYPTKHASPRKTYIMGTFNVGPDSFLSDGRCDTLPSAIAYTTDAVTSGANIIDIRGYTAHPNFEFVQVEEEFRRVVPVVKAIREHPSSNLRNTLISICTCRREIAEAAVRAGANCINDVNAFMGPTNLPGDEAAKHRAKMRDMARELCVPVVLTHSCRERNKDYSAYPGGVVSAVQMELGIKVNEIVRGPNGVRRWLVFVDPGIGFSKSEEDQRNLLRDLKRLMASDEPKNPLARYPLLLGVSKKSPSGAALKLPGVEGACKEREATSREKPWATATVVAGAVEHGTSVVRVHEVAEMRDVVDSASAIWSG